MILIISENNDRTTTEVIRWIHLLGKKFIRIHEDELFEIKVIQKKIFVKSNRYQEYGIVEGKVQNISLSPDEKGNYYVDVILPRGLKTSYNKNLSFDKELKGNAEIVTEDLRLIEHFFYQIRRLLKFQL